MNTGLNPMTDHDILPVFFGNVNRLSLAQIQGCFLGAKRVLLTFYSQYEYIMDISGLFIPPLCRNRNYKGLGILLGFLGTGVKKSYIDGYSFFYVLV